MEHFRCASVMCSVLVPLSYTPTPSPLFHYLMLSSLLFSLFIHSSLLASLLFPLSSHIYPVLHSRIFSCFLLFSRLFRSPPDLFSFLLFSLLLSLPSLLIFLSFYHFSFTATPIILSQDLLSVIESLQHCRLVIYRAHSSHGAHHFRSESLKYSRFKKAS